MPTPTPSPSTRSGNPVQTVEQASVSASVRGGGGLIDPEDVASLRRHVCPSCDMSDEERTWTDGYNQAIENALLLDRRDA